MLSTIERTIEAQAAITMSAERALAIARERFPNLCSAGILGKRATGLPVGLWHIDKALSFLAQCRKSKIPAVHSHDLCGAIGVSVGAAISAAHALGFDVRGWMGSREFFPGAMIGVNAADVARRVAELSL
jgi:hypothetical protein